MQRQNQTTASNLKEINITRVFDASRELVWKFFTEADLMTNWWGPKNFTAPFGKIDFRVGGEYLFDMRGPDGKDYWSKGTYREIKAPELIVATDSFSDEKGNTVLATYYGLSAGMPSESQVTMTFEQIEENKTTFTLKYLGVTDQDYSNAMTGWNESFDKLADYLAKYYSGNETNIMAPPGTQNIIITRLFNAPRDIVFRMCTDPGTLAQWWGPRSMTTIVDKMDVRPGGEWRFVNRYIQGNKSGFHGVYHEVKVPEKLVYTFEWEGMPGHVILETDTFEELDGKTRIMIEMVFQSVQDRDGMLASGMEKGMKESHERFAELLEQKTAAIWENIPEE